MDGDLSHTYSQWKATAPKKSTEAKAVTGESRAEARKRHLMEKYGRKWRERTKRTESTGEKEGELAEEEWLRQVLFTPSNRAARQMACSMIESLCQVFMLKQVADITNVQWFLLMKSTRVIKLSAAPSVPWHLWCASYTSHFARCLNKSFPVTWSRELQLFNSGLKANTTVISLLNNNCIASAICFVKLRWNYWSFHASLRVVGIATYRFVFSLVVFRYPVDNRTCLICSLGKCMNWRTFSYIVTILSIRHRSMASHNVTILTGSSVKPRLKCWGCIPWRKYKLLEKLVEKEIVNVCNYVKRQKCFDSSVIFIFIFYHTAIWRKCVVQEKMQQSSSSCTKGLFSRLTGSFTWHFREHWCRLDNS